MEKGSGTRSGLLWEVERLLNECKELPQVLLMENVPLVHGKKNMATFNNWIAFLESKGYSNYWKDLNAKDYGVPQSRNRCFMVSILGGSSYEFPPVVKLDKTLGDVLEEKVDARYYLTEERYTRIANWNAQQNPLERVNGTNSISPTPTARGAGEYHSGMVLFSPYVSTTTNLRGSVLQREVCQKAIELTKPYEVIDYTYSNSRLSEIENGEIKLKNKMDPDIMCTLTTNAENFGVRLPSDAFRVLTPRECWRLMGFSDDDFDRACQVSEDKDLYKQAGNSIVVDVLMAIFKNILNTKSAQPEGEDDLDDWML
jgi:DNA (cytosine-5)-methyltransferase 1